MDSVHYICGMSSEGITPKPIRRTTRRKTVKEKEYICVNCGHTFAGTYCNQCGQHRDTKRLTSRELWDNIAFRFVNFDRGIPNTIRRLFTHPGRMIREYILGHRVTYSHPMALLILLCTVYGIVIGLTHAAVTQMPSAGDLNIMLKGTPVDTGGWLDSESPFIRVISYIINVIRRSTIFQAVLPVPFFAWAARRLFRKYGSREYNYAEMLFACLYMAAQRMVVSIVLQPFIIAFPDAGFLSTLKTLLYLFLTAWTFREMFGMKWLKTIWKSILMFVVGWTLLGVAGLAVVIAGSVLVIIISAIFGAVGLNEWAEFFKDIFGDI